MSLQDRSRSLVILILWLLALGYPQVASAEPESPSPSAQSQTSDALSGEVSPAVPGGLVELGPGPDPQSTPDPQPSDVAGTEAFSPQGPLFPIRDNAEVRRFVEHFQTGDRRPIVERWIERSGRYGLRVDRSFDERLDPEKSTVAAAR